MRSRNFTLLLVLLIAPGVFAASKNPEGLNELSKSRAVAPNHKRLVDHYREQRDGRAKIKEKRARLKGKSLKK